MSINESKQLESVDSSLQFLVHSPTDERVRVGQSLASKRQVHLSIAVEDEGSGETSGKNNLRNADDEDQFGQAYDPNNIPPHHPIRAIRSRRKKIRSAMSVLQRSDSKNDSRERSDSEVNSILDDGDDDDATRDNKLAKIPLELSPLGDDTSSSSSSSSNDRLLLASMASFEFSANGTLITGGFTVDEHGVREAPIRYSISSDADGGCVEPNTGRSDVSSNSSPPHHISLKKSTISLNELGRGACGTVFRAVHVPSLKVLAIKRVRVFDKDKRKQLVCELGVLYSLCKRDLVDGCEVSAAAGKEFVVSFFDAYTDMSDSTVCMALEYMGVGSLQSFVDNGLCLPNLALSEVSYSVLQGLEYMHSCKMIHRDIKPSNILLNMQGMIKIGDFGIIRDLTMTMNAQTFTGTIFYMSPERIKGDEYSYSSDLWSLGISLIALATASLPFSTHQGLWGMLSAVQFDLCEKLDREKLSVDFISLVSSCLRQTPSERPTAREMLNGPCCIRGQTTVKLRQELFTSGTQSSSSSSSCRPSSGSSRSDIALDPDWNWIESLRPHPTISDESEEYAKEIAIKIVMLQMEMNHNHFDQDQSSLPLEARFQRLDRIRLCQLAFELSIYEEYLIRYYSVSFEKARDLMIKCSGARNVTLNALTSKLTMIMKEIPLFYRSKRRPVASRELLISSSNADLQLNASSSRAVWRDKFKPLPQIMASLVLDKEIIARQQLDYVEHHGVMQQVKSYHNRPVSAPLKEVVTSSNRKRLAKPSLSSQVSAELN